MTLGFHVKAALAPEADQTHVSLSTNNVRVPVRSSRPPLRWSITVTDSDRAPDCLRLLAADMLPTIATFFFDILQIEMTWPLRSLLIKTVNIARDGIAEGKTELTDQNGMLYENTWPIMK